MSVLMQFNGKTRAN